MNAIQSSVKQLSGEDPLEEAFRLCRPGGLVALVLLAVFLLTAPAAHAQAPGYTQVSPGYTNTSALKTDGSIDCWGTNLSGQSKDQAGSFLQVTTGSDHSCAIMNTGQVDRGPVTCWGSNQEAQLQKPSGDFREISAGYMYTCGLTDGYDVNCWWYNYDGQANDQTGPYKHVFASIYHTCGLKLDGSVNCWGASSYGEAGDRTGPYTQIAVGGFHNCAIRSSDSQLECWGAGTKDTNLYPDYGQAMPPAGKFVDVAAGGALHVRRAGRSHPRLLGLQLLRPSQACPRGQVQAGQRRDGRARLRDVRLERAVLLGPQRLWADAHSELGGSD